jgi:hypothetical protein
MEEPTNPLVDSEEGRLISNDPLEIAEATPTVTFRAEHPGRYLISLAVEDDTGNRSTTIVVAEVSPAEVFALRGIGTGLILPEMDYLSEYLSIIENLNANLIQIGVQGFTPTLTSSEVRSCSFTWSPGTGCTTPSPDDLARIIEAAHKRGIEVMLKMNLVIGNYLPSWQQAPDWRQWFSLEENDPSYANWVLEWADFAQQHGVGHLVVGNEMVNSHSYPTGWRELVMAVRDVYSGQLTYSDNYWVFFNNGSNKPFPACDLLDYQGLNFYYRGSGGAVGGRAETNPSIGVMRENLKAQIETMFLPALEACGNKPVVLTEMSISNYDGSNQTPEDTGGIGKVRDDIEQAEFFSAALELMSDYPWVHGAVAWEYQLTRTPWSVANNDILPDIRDRPAEDVIRIFFASAVTG